MATPSVYRAVADPTRRRLLDSLRTEADQSLSQLCQAQPTSRQAIAKHLGILQEAGLVEVRTVGRERRHRLNAQPLEEVATWLASYTTFWTQRLDALESRIREQHRPS